jgi:hypothetical protein
MTLKYNISKPEVIRDKKKSQYMKAIRDVHSFFQEESVKIESNQPVIPLTAIVAHLCAAFKICESLVRATLKEF